MRKVTRGMWAVDLLNDTILMALLPSLLVLLGSMVLDFVTPRELTIYMIAAATAPAINTNGCSTSDGTYAATTLTVDALEIRFITRRASLRR